MTNDPILRARRPPREGLGILEDYQQFMGWGNSYTALLEQPIPPEVLPEEVLDPRIETQPPKITDDEILRARVPSGGEGLGVLEEYQHFMGWRDSHTFDKGS